jgi:mannosyltransferase
MAGPSETTAGGGGTRGVSAGGPGQVLRRRWVPVVLLTVLAALLRIPTLGSQSYWYDEAITVSLLRRSLFGMLHGVESGESAPPLYYVLAWLWARGLGTGEFELRLLSALIGIATVPVVYAAAGVLGSRRTALVAGALAATSPILVWYSQEARAYSLLVFLASASFLFFARALDRPTLHLLALWAIASTLALATHYFAAFVVGPELVLLVALHVRMRRVYVAVGAVVLCGAALLPLAAVQTTHNTFAWIGHIALSRRSGDALRRLLIASEPSSWWGATGVDYLPYLWIPAVALVLLAAVALVARGEPSERRAGAITFVVALMGFGAALAMAYAADRVTGHRGDTFLDRNLLALWVPLNLFVAIGLTIRRAGVYGLAVAAIVCVAAGGVTVVIATDPTLERDDWRSAARTIDGSREAVLVYPAYQAAALLEQRGALVDLPQRGASIDQIVLLLPGFQEPPDSFRAPRPFAADGVQRIQNITVFAFRSDGAHLVRPRDLVHGPLANSDLRILVTPT